MPHLFSSVSRTSAELKMLICVTFVMSTSICLYDLISWSARAQQMWWWWWCMGEEKHPIGLGLVLQTGPSCVLYVILICFHLVNLVFSFSQFS